MMKEIAMYDTYLPGDTRQRIQDLIKNRKITQAGLAEKVVLSNSALSRYLQGGAKNLGDGFIIRIAKYFDVSTDFLLGETDIPERKNYDTGQMLSLDIEPHNEQDKDESSAEYYANSFLYVFFFSFFILRGSPAARMRRHAHFCIGCTLWCLWQEHMQVYGTRKSALAVISCTMPPPEERG